MTHEYSLECRRIFEQISDFIDGEAAPEVCRHIEEHLKGCRDCDNFIDSVRKTVELYRKESSYMPEEARTELHRLMEEQCRELKKKK